MATTKKQIAPFQPVFPTQYPQECQSCKTPNACERFMAAGLTADSCIFICPRKHRGVSPSKQKNDANMVTDPAPGASDFVTKGNRKIFLLRAFLIPGTAESRIPRGIRPRRKAQQGVFSSACSPPIFFATLNPSILVVAGTIDVVAGDEGLVAG